MRMNRFSLIVLGSIASVSFAASTEHAPGSTVLSGKFVQCRPAICGLFPQNLAGLQVSSSAVEVTDAGSVRITLFEMRVIETGEIAANYPLEVFFGSFIPGSYWVEGLGHVVTDCNGNFDGPIDAGGGVPFVFPPGTTVAGNFILNSPVPRSEFINGIAIPHVGDDPGGFGN